MKYSARCFRSLILAVVFFCSLVFLPHFARAQAPDNAACSAAVGLVDGQTLTGFSNEVPLNLTTTCVGDAGTGLWYYYTPASTGMVRVTTAGSSYNTVLQIYEGTCESLVPVACNDNSCSGTAAEVLFPGTAGTTYLIMAGGTVQYNMQGSITSSARGQLKIAAKLGGSIPINDDCSGAIALTPGITFTMSTANATASGEPEKSCNLVVTPSVWFTVTPLNNGPISFKATAVGFNPVVNLFTGSCGAMSAVGPCLQSGNTSSMTFLGTAGRTYYIMVSGQCSTGTLTMFIPANDKCIEAIPLTDSATYTIDTQFATATGDPTLSCGTNVGKGVWFSYFAASDGITEIKTWGSNFDTVMQVYAGTCASLTAIACNDNASPCASGTATLQSMITFPALGGNTYLILVGGAANTSGRLRIQAKLGGPVPPNDLCIAPIPLTESVTLTMDTRNATTAGDPVPGCQPSAGKGVWFTFTPPASLPVTVDTRGSTFGTVLQVYTGSCGAFSPVVCADLDNAACDGGGASSVTFGATGGVTYFILATGDRPFSGGTLNMLVTMQIGDAPSNDQCGTAIQLSNNLTFTQNISAAGSISDPASICGQPVDKGVWFSFRATANASLSVSTCGSDYDTALQVFRGTCAAPIDVGCSDDACGVQSALIFPATNGVTYTFFVGAKSFPAGKLRIVVAQVPSNDQCTNPVTLSAGTTFSMNTGSATTFNEPSVVCSDPAGKGVWFRFTAKPEASVSFSTVGSDYDTVMEIFTGSCGVLNSEACNDDAIGTQAAKLIATPGATTTYTILVSGKDSASGNLRLRATYVPSNDECDGAITLVNGATFTLNTGSATGVNDPLPSCSLNSGKGVWFTFSPPSNGTIAISTCGSAYDTVLQVLTGDCGGVLTPLVCNDNTCGSQSAVEFIGQINNVYRVLVTGAAGASGTLRIRATFEPVNDRCDGAIALGGGAAFIMDTTNATSIGDPASICGVNVSKGVWFRYDPNPNNDTLVTVQTCGSNYDTVLQIYEGDCGSLASVSCNDDLCGDQSESTFLARVGKTYRFFVAGFGGETGTLSINVAFTPTIPNDRCAGAIELSNGLPFVINTGNATSTGDPVLSCDNTGGNGVWFTFTPAVNGAVVVQTVDTEFDTAFAVYTGSCGSLTLLTCDDDGLTQCGVTTNSTFSFLSFPGVAGQTYRILAAGKAGATGTLKIKASISGATPTNDLCVGAIPLLDNQTTTLSTANATTAGDIPVPSSAFPFSGRGVWFTYTPPISDEVKVITSGSNFTTMLAVYSGSCANLTEISSNLPTAGTGIVCQDGIATLSFPGTASVTYTIYAGSALPTETGLLSIRASVPQTSPSNDACAGAVTLTNGQTFTEQTFGATSGGDSGTICGQPAGKGVWFTFTPISNGTVTISTCGSDYDTALQILTNGCNVRTQLVCNDDSCGFQSAVTFEGVANTSYLIFVAGVRNAFGLLKVRAFYNPINDRCADAITLANGVTFTVSTVGATSVPDPATVCGQNIGRGVWYTFTPLSNGTVNVSTCGSDFDTLVQIFSGSCTSLTALTCNDDSCGFQSRANFIGTGGVTYRIFAGGKGSKSGALRVQASYVPINDLCSNTVTLTNNVTITIDTTGATSDGEPKSVCNLGVGKGVWFTFQPPGNGTFNVSTAGSNFDTVVQVYTGNCASLTTVGCNDDAPGLVQTSSFDFQGNASVTYAILVSGFDATGGGTLDRGILNVVVTPSVPPPPVITNNDTCTFAITLTNAVTLTMNTATATNAGDPLPSCGTNFGRGVWFTFTTAANGNINISTLGSSFNTVIQVYTGSCGAPSTLTCSNSGTQSRLSFGGVAGTVYRILVGGNNQTGGTLRIVANGPVLPDYVLESVTLNKTLYLPGEKGTATVTVVNKGGSTTIQGYSLDLFRHASNPVTCNAAYNVRVVRPALPPGATSVWEIPFTIGATEGNFVLRVFADAACSVPESNEDNNQLTFNYSVQAGLPDLVIESLSLDATNYGTNQVGIATIVVKNQGIGTTLVGFKTSLFINRTTAAGCGIASDNAKTLGVLAGGRTLTTTMTFTTSAGIGTRMLRVFVDADCAIPESSNVNNQATLNYDVVRGNPDLIVESFSFDKTTYTPGEMATVTITIRNQGSIGTGSGYAVALFREAPATAGCDQTPSKKYNRSALAAGAADTFTVSLPVLTALKPNYVGRLMVDHGCVITEAIETNNQAIFNYSVVAPPVGPAVINGGTPTP